MPDERDTADLLRRLALTQHRAAEYERANEALRAGEARLRTLFDAIDQGMAVVEIIYGEDHQVVDMIFRQVNSAYERMAGIRDVVGRSVRQVFPDSEDVWLDSYRRVAMTGDPVRVEDHRRDVDRWFDVFFSRIDDLGCFVATVCNDITERKRAEEALRASEMRQAFLLTLGDAMRAQATASGKIEVAACYLGEQLDASRVLYGEYDWDRGVADIFGGWFADGARSFPTVMRLEEYDGEVLNDLRAGRTVRVDHVGLLVEEPAYAAIADVGVQALLSVPLIVDGRLAVNVSIHQHEPRRWTDDEVALVQEVAERLWAEVVRARAEAALRASEKRFRALVTAGTYSVYRMSPDWRIMYQLDSQTLANTSDPIVDWTDKYILDEDRDEVRAAIDQAIGTKSLFELEHRVRRADGGVGWVLSRAVPLLDDDGAIAEWFGAGSDVTERRATADRLRGVEDRHREDLERQVRERTSELKAGRDLLQATMDSSLDMIQVFEAVRDDAGGVVDFRWVLNNHGSESRHGDVRGESLLERNPGVVAEGIFDAFRRVTETGMPEQAERHYIHEQFDGWFYQSVVRLGDGVATTTKEISDWKAAQAEILLLQEEIAQARLRESEARLEAVFAALPVGVHVADEKGRTVLTNAELSRFLPTGVIPSQDPERGGRWRAWDADGHLIELHDFPGARSLRGETVVPGIEMLYTDDTGQEIWTAVSSTPIRNAQGDIIGQVGVVSDIDALKRNADALRASEERLRQFGEASQDVLWMRDAEKLQWQYLTPAFEEIYGLGLEEALSGDNYRSWLELIVPEDRPHATENIRLVRQGDHVTFDYRIRRPRDGEIRWLRNTDFPITNAAGEVVMIGGIGQDITDAKLAQERTEQSEERLRSAVEVGQLGLWDWNVYTDQVHWSDEHFRMEGYRVGEVKPSYETWAARLHPEDREATLAALRRAMDNHEEYVREFRVVHPDGSVHWLYGRGRFFYDDENKPARMIGAMIDTTARREWEEHQKVLIAELQHRTLNLMGVVRSMSEKTARASTDLADFRSRFRYRLEALSRVQSLLSRLKEHDRVTFDDLVRTELTAMGGGSDRVALSGPAGVRLRSSTVQTLAMALHELATNAVKYGALGQSAGRLAITWSVEPEVEGGKRWLHIDWRETGVAMPPPESAPGGTGQGRELIEKALPYQLRARTSYRLEPDGVHCTISIPVSTSTAEAEEHA